MKVLFKTIIVEDEYPATIRLKNLISSYPCIEIIDCLASGKAAIKSINTLSPDVIFLDIHLLDMTGFDILASLQYEPLIIFTTAYEDYAIKAFNTFSVDYLVKPIKKDRLDQAIEKLKVFGHHKSISSDLNAINEVVKKLKSKSIPTTLPIKKGNKILLIDHEDIYFIKSEDKYSMISVHNGDTSFCEKSMAHLAEHLPSNFIRIHRSYIINKNHIHNIQRFIKGRHIITIGDLNMTQLRTSDGYKGEFKRELGL